MRIITVNLPVSYLTAMDNLIGEKAIYPSRSELIRVAVREFLIKELESVKSFAQFQNKIAKKTEPAESSETFIKVPIDADEITGESDEQMFRMYKIIKK